MPLPGNKRLPPWLGFSPSLVQTPLNASTKANSRHAVTILSCVMQSTDRRSEHRSAMASTVVNRMTRCAPGTWGKWPAAAGVELRTAPCGKFQRYHRSWRFVGSFRFCCMVYYAASSASGVHRRRLLRGSVICCFAGCGVEQATATVSKSE